MIDTHAHIYLDKYKDDIDLIIDRSIEKGIDKIFMPNIDCSSIAVMYAVEQRYPEYTASMMGLHPCSVKADYRDELAQMKKELEARTFIAIGEIGIDLYWDDTYYKEQVEAFKEQVNWALAYNLPIVIHSRDSIDIILDLLEGWGYEDLRGVFHCFGGSREQINRIRGLGFLIGIGGVLTFKNSGLRDVLLPEDLDMIILETDAPFLAPVPYRGKRNEPSYVSIIAETLAEVLDVDLNIIAELTTDNALNLFEMSHFFQKNASEVK